ncbi:MAG TPA: EAL domain-containing protein [Conexibacter sp.]|nr:EAL domain-containing protein [Conexibacter sp.]
MHPEPHRTGNTLLPLTLVLAAVLVIVGAVVGIDAVGDDARTQSRAQLLLSEAQTSANRLDGLEWRAIAKSTAAAEDMRQVEALRGHALARLQRLPKPQAGVAEAFDRYASAVQQELELLAAGRLKAAEAVDERLVDPGFERLNARLERAAADVGRQVRETDRRARNLTRLILALAGLGVAGLLVALYRGRRAALLRREAARKLRLIESLAREHEHEANHDALTGLVSRRHFLQRLEAEVTRAGEDGGRPLAVLLIDLDHFKEINDTLGHHAGDVVLSDLAPRMQAALREHDLLARLGGDEFALLVPAGANVERTALAELAGRVTEAIRRPLEVHGITLQVDASVGVAVFPEDGDDAEMLLRHADVAMYRAKADRSSCAFYAANADPHSREQLVLTAELRAAIECSQLVVHYQPKAQLASGTITSVEALVRWQHPDRGLLLPDAFLAAAEQAGLMRPLTLFVLDASLAQCAAWNRGGLDVGVAVNLSVTNLVDRALPGDVAVLLRRHGIDGRRLQLEITENLLMADPSRSTEVMRELAALGVSLSLDDFGTGHSSLAYLKRFNVDEIKIDRSFVMGMRPGSDDAAIVKSTVGLARSLGLRVVAEGVESDETWRRLLEVGCHQGQGFYISEPVPADQLTDLLRDGMGAPDPRSLSSRGGT